MSSMQLTEEEWKQKLTPEQFRILRQKGTEAPFSGDLLNENRKGMFSCAACGAELFSSSTKYESKTQGLAGWPSFSEVAKSDAVNLVDDDSMGMIRVEVVCKQCGSHLGHVFDGDVDSSTGKHYCINSTCLAFNAIEGQGK